MDYVKRFRDKRWAIYAHKLGYISEKRCKSIIAAEADVEKYLQESKKLSHYRLDTVRMMFIDYCILMALRQRNKITKKACSILLKKQLDSFLQSDIISCILEPEIATKKILSLSRKFHELKVFSDKDYNFLCNTLQHKQQTETVNPYEMTIANQDQIQQDPNFDPYEQTFYQDTFPDDSDTFPDDSDMFDLPTLIDAPVPINENSQKGYTESMSEIISEEEIATLETMKYDSDSYDELREHPFFAIADLLNSNVPVKDDSFQESHLGMYTLLKPLAQGGMGKLFLAYDGLAEKEVVVKILKENLSEKSIARFKREAEVHSCLNGHQNIIEMYEFCYSPQLKRYYIVMEYIRGLDLAKILKQYTFTTKEALHIIFEVTQAMNFLASKNIIHRDIKPGNIMIAAKDGCVKLADFGLGKIIAEIEQIPLTDHLLGTPYYMAPEQIQNSSNVDQRADIYSLGATLYTLLGGKPPYSDCGGQLQILQAKINQDPTPLVNISSNHSDEVYELVEKSMSRLARNRYQTFTEMAMALKKIMT